MSKKHSPLLLEVNQESPNEILDSKGYMVAEAEDESLAALIVRAVNAHEALVEACKIAEEWMADDGCACGAECDPPCGLCVVRAARKKAGME